MEGRKGGGGGERERERKYMQVGISASEQIGSFRDFYLKVKARIWP